MSYLHGADLVGNKRTRKQKSLVSDLEYADYMALLADNWSDLTAMLDSLSTCCKKLGLLTISCKKTKMLAVLASGIQSPVPIYLFPGDEPIAHGCFYADI